MDQDTARTLARDAGERAMALGLSLAEVSDPDCAELVDACRRALVPVAAILR